MKKTLTNIDLEQARLNYYKARLKRAKAVKKGCGEYEAMKLQAKVVRCERRFDEIAKKLT